MHCELGCGAQSLPKSAAEARRRGRAGRAKANHTSPQECNHNEAEQLDLATEQSDLGVYDPPDMLASAVSDDLADISRRFLNRPPTLH